MAMGTITFHYFQVFAFFFLSSFAHIPERDIRLSQLYLVSIERLIGIATEVVNKVSALTEPQLLSTCTKMYANEQDYEPFKF
jgi:hypothetical protein